MAYICGVDIGAVNGAFAILDKESRKIVQLLPLPLLDNGKKELDEVEVMGILSSYELEHLFIEKIGAMPGQGIVSTGRFMTAWGLVRGICVGMGIPYTMILPQRWKKLYLDGLPKGKDSSLVRANQVFPELQLSKKKDHNKADAIFIALYGIHVMDGF